MVDVFPEGARDARGCIPSTLNLVHSPPLRERDSAAIGSPRVGRAANLGPRLLGGRRSWPKFTNNQRPPAASGLVWRRSSRRFSGLGVTSFGGGTAAWLYRAIVQRRHWIDDPTYLVDVGLSRVMPGSAGVNLTVQIGQRLRGGWGALAAVFGLLSGPLFIVVGLAAGFARIAGSPVAHAFLDGVAGAAIGLTFATGLVLVPRGRTQIGQLLITIATVVVGRRAALADAARHSVPGADRDRAGAGAAAGAQLTCQTTGAPCWR